MKTKRLVAMLMAIAIAMCLFVMPSSAADEAEQTHTNIEIIFEDETLSEEFKAKATAYFLNGAPEDDGATTYGLTCNLFGHKLESTQTTTITHKVRTTSPRCLKKAPVSKRLTIMLNVSSGDGKNRLLFIILLAIHQMNITAVRKKSLDNRFFTSISPFI